MTSNSMSVELEDGLTSRLSEKAKRYDKPVSYLVNAAIKRMIADDDYILAKIDSGLADFEAGRVTLHEDVMREGYTIIEQARIKQTS